MEKKGNTNSRRKDACEKMSKAASVCPAVQAIRRMGHRLHWRRPASTVPISSAPKRTAKNIDTLSKPDSVKNHKSMEDVQLHNHDKLKNREAAEVVPIIFDYYSSLQPAVSNGGVAKAAASNREPEASAPANILGGKFSRQRTEANPKFEAPHVSKEESNKSGVHIEDRFTDYINRAKIKIRAMSNVGDNEENASGKDYKKVLGKDHSHNAFVTDKFTEYINRAKIKIRSTSSIRVGKYDSFE